MHTAAPEEGANDINPLDLVTVAVTFAAVTTMAVPLSVASHVPGVKVAFPMISPCGAGIVVCLVWTTRMMLPAHTCSLSCEPSDIWHKAPSEALVNDDTVCALTMENWAAKKPMMRPNKVFFRADFFIN